METLETPMPPKNRRKNNWRDEVKLPVTVPVRLKGRVIANLILREDETLVAEWSVDYCSVPWRKGERERLANNACRMLEALAPSAPVTQNSCYEALWPGGGKKDNA